MQNHLAEKHIKQKPPLSKTIDSTGSFSIYSDMIIKFVPALKS
ncbi:MAG: hypothetical protein V4619_17685 [Bacteroidota bacterium]